MTFRLKDILHKSLSDSVFNDLFSGRSNYYYFIGKVVPWSTPGSPPTPDETRTVEHDTRNRIINIKKITTGDTSLVIPRKNWSSNRKYDQFNLNYSTTNLSTTGASSLKTSDFYVLNSTFQVYKCINNNNGGDSTVEPSGNLLDVFTTADGYQWKFMYTIPVSLRSRFLTDDFMPVTKSVLESFYSDGQINSVTVDSKGSGYTAQPVVNLIANVHFVTASDGTASVPGANTPNLKPVINESTGAIEDVLITFAGSNVAGGNILVNDSDGTGSNLFPNVTLSLGSNAAVTTVIGDTANFIPVISGGEFKDVLVLDPGKNYTSNGNTTITVSGDGTGAIITPFINDAGELENAIISERGTGYTNAVLNVIGSGTGANLSVSFSTGDLDTSQSKVELSAIDGAIHNYTIVSGGTQYNTTPTITITGDGTGATATATGDFGTGNAITGITVTNAGSGYTFANVVVTAAAGSPGSGADIQPIFSPPNGHGFDAPTELFADSLMFFSTISDEKIHDVTINNDFRQFGIIKDIEQSVSKRMFGNALGTPTFSANLTNILSAGGNTLVADNIVELSTDSTIQFAVVEVSVAPSANTVILTSLNNYTLTGSEILKTPDNTDTFTINAINKSPDINKFSGEMLFIDNRTAVTFSDEQLVTFRTILRL